MQPENLYVERLIAYRKSRKINQQELSKRLGFKNRQSWSDIENFKRKISPEEIVLALEVLDVDFEEFTDPYTLFGEATYSWRQHDANVDILESFEKQTNKIIALYRELHNQYALPKPSVLMPKLPIQKRSAYSIAKAYGERLADELKLGEFPADNLNCKIFEKFNIATFYLDTPSCVSGAATKLDDMFIILINRNEVTGRRNFDTAHELFHCLTWDAIPPQHIEKAYRSADRPHEEKLADTFASALLMPSASIDKHIDLSRTELDESGLNLIANKYKVSSQAMKWKLKNLNKISKQKADSFDDKLLAHNGIKDAGIKGADIKPKLFNEQFVTYLHTAIDNGDLSVRKIASTIGLSIDSLTELFRSYEIEPPFDL